MTDLRKAAEMALEALEWNYGTDLCDIENCTAWLDKMNATISALRQALAQPDEVLAEREACAKVCDGISEHYKTRTDLNQSQKQVGQLAAEVCGVRIRERGER